jgi:hypothetical protein
LAGVGQRPAGSTLELPLVGRGGVPAEAQTVQINVAAVDPTEAGFLTVFACGEPQPNASSVNFRANDTKSNLVVARLDGQGRTCVYSSAATDLTVDVQGYTVDALTSVEPARLLDTRSRTATVDGEYAAIGARGTGSTTALPVRGRAGVPGDANTVLLNVTAVNASAPGFITVHACGTSRPNASNVNYAPGEAQSNLVVTRLDDQGRACIFTRSSSDIVVDVQGYVIGANIVVAPPERYPSSDAGFVHPGVLIGGADLDQLRADIDAGRQPWRDAFQRVRSNGYSSLNYTPSPVPSIQATGSCSACQTALAENGWSNIGGVEHLNDTRAAYSHALMWALTGNQAYANKAIEIMNAWSNTLVEIKFDQPRRADGGRVFDQGALQAGWGGSLFARAAEIIRHTGAGWSDDDVARFENMLTTIYLPLVRDTSTTGANWIMTFAEATTAIGVFTNDRAAFDAGITRWRNQIAATIYLTSDGPVPQTPSDGYRAEWLPNLWRTTSYIDGLQQETLRDLAHMTMGIGAMANTAEIAYLQGVDLYGEQATRITTGLETNAGFVNQYLDEVARLGGATPPSTWIPNGWPGAAGTFRVINSFYQVGWLVAQHHYTTRAGIDLPQTTRLVQRLGNTATQPALHMTWETLTHNG